MTDKFHVSSEDDILPTVKYIWECWMEKKPGVVVCDDREYHIDVAEKSFIGNKWPPILAKIFSN